MGSFETMHTCYGYLEDVNVNCADGKIIFDKITAFSTEIILRLALKKGSKFVFSTPPRVFKQSR